MSLFNFLIDFHKRVLSDLIGKELVVLMKKVVDDEILFAITDFLSLDISAIVGNAFTSSSISHILLSLIQTVMLSSFLNTLTQTLTLTLPALWSSFWPTAVRI